MWAIVSATNFWNFIFKYLSFTNIHPPNILQNYTTTGVPNGGTGQYRARAL
jgi:hypothetical protein